MADVNNQPMVAEPEAKRWTRTDFDSPCEFTPTVCDGPVFRWKFHPWLQVSASRSGVVVTGDSPQMGERQVERLKGLIDLVCSVHRQLNTCGWGTPDGLWFGDHFEPWSSFSRS